MSRTGATFNLLVSEWYPAVEGEVIDPDASNAMLEDIAQGLTDSVSRDGSGSMSGNLNMGTHKLTSLLAGSSASDSVRYDQVQLANAFATAWEGASWASGKMGYATGASAVSLIDTTAAGRAILNFTDPNADKIAYWRDSDGTWQSVTLSAQFSFSGGTLGLDADLGTWATLTPSAFFQTLVDDADAATFRSTIGLGALSTVTPGTGVATALAVNVGTDGAFVVKGGALGTPSSGVATNLTGLPISSGVSGLGTNVATALGVNVGTAGAFVVNGGALGTPASGVLTNCTGLPNASVVGLGTAALKNTSTSGNNVPLLDGANTWSGAQTFGTSTQGIIANGTSQNAKIKLQHNSVDTGFIGSNGTYAVGIINAANTTLLADFPNSGGMNIGGVAIASAAFKATGTSGNTVPLLDGANTWSADQTISKATPTLYLIGTSTNIPEIQLQNANRYDGWRNTTSGMSFRYDISGTPKEMLWNGSSLTLNAVAIPTISSTDAITNKQIRTPISSETTGSLTSASANKTVQCSGGVTMANAVFTAGDVIVLDPGTSARTITRGASVTMYVNGTDSATATLAANQMGGVMWRSSSVCVLSGAVS